MSDLSRRWVDYFGAEQDSDAVHRDARSEATTEMDAEAYTARGVHSASDHEVHDGCGVRYQKCGGGRRVIRKQQGSN